MHVLRKVRVVLAVIQFNLHADGVSYDTILGAQSVLYR